MTVQTSRVHIHFAVPDDGCWITYEIASGKLTKPTPGVAIPFVYVPIAITTNLKYIHFTGTVLNSSGATSPRWRADCTDVDIVIWSSLRCTGIVTIEGAVLWVVVLVVARHT